MHIAVQRRETQRHTFRLGVLHHVLERLLGDPVERHLHVGRKLARGDVHLDLGADHSVGQALQAGAQTEVVEQRRPQAGDGPAGLVEGGAGEVLGRAQFVDHHRRIDGESIGRLQVVPEADEPLTDAVVDLPGQVTPFHLLGLDDAGSELLQRLLPFGESFVEPGVLDGAGHEIPDLGQQGDVVLAVAAGLAGVDVDHTDHRLAPTQQRDGYQRLVVLPPQGGDVEVPLVLPLVGDDGRFGVERHPTRHTLAEGELNRSRQAGERRSRSHEDQPLTGPVEDVDEAQVGAGRLSHENGDLLGYLPEIEIRRGDLDDPPQQPILAEEVGPEGPRLGRRLAGTIVVGRTNGRCPRAAPRRSPATGRSRPACGRSTGCAS